MLGTIIVANSRFVLPDVRFFGPEAGGPTYPGLVVEPVFGGYSITWGRNVSIIACEAVFDTALPHSITSQSVLDISLRRKVVFAW